MALISAHVTIQGTRPMLWNHFGPDAIPLETREKRGGKAGNDPSEWQGKVLKTAAGQLYVEPASIFGCLRAGAKFTPRKKSTLQPLVGATVQVMDGRVLIDRWMPKNLADLNQTGPVSLDIRSVRNPATGARNIRYRIAASVGWKATFEVCWDNTVLSEEEMEAVARDAGRLAGLGDGRTIGFGRFEVLAFKIMRNAKKQTTRRGVGGH